MYTNEEPATIHFIYGLADDNALQTHCRLYQERYPTHRCPNRKTFGRIHRRLCEDGSFVYMSGNKGRLKNTTPEVQEEILDIVHQDPGISTGRIGTHASVWRLLHEQQSTMCIVLVTRRLFSASNVLPMVCTAMWR